MKIFSLTRLLVFESTTSGNEQETSVLSKLITETKNNAYDNTRRPGREATSN